MSTERQNLYEVLGLPRDAGRDLIEKQCIRLGERYRSDKNSGDLRPALLFAQVERAYETLVDPVKRAAYDAELRSEAIAQDHAAIIGTVGAPTKSASASTATRGDISLHSKLNSWIALLFLLVVFKVLSDVLSKLAAKWLQTNNFDPLNVTTVGATTGVIAAFVVVFTLGRFLAGIIPLRPPLSGILMTRGATEIAPGNRILATIAMLVLALTVLEVGFIADRSQREEVARIADENAKRAAEASAQKAAAENARALAAQERIAEERARIAEAQAQAQAQAQQAKADQDRAAASYDARARADAKELARIEVLRQQCEAFRSGENTGPAGASFALAAIRFCAAYEQAAKERQYYEALKRQGR